MNQMMLGRRQFLRGSGALVVAFAMTDVATALLRKTPRPSEAQAREALAGNLCRCGSHVRVLRAVMRASEGGRT